MREKHGGWFLLWSLIATAVAALAFAPGLPGEFIFDDIPNITTNTAVHLIEWDVDAVARLLTGLQLSGTTRSLPMLTFAIDYWRAGGPDPLIFKITNIAIHAATAAVLAWFFRSLLLTAGLTGSRLRWVALGLALAWAVHPLQVSSVLYVVQRLQLMGTFFLLLALWAYLQARRAQIDGRSGRKGMLLSALLWLLAMGCKEDSALLPAYALALELTVLRFAAADEHLARRLRRGYLVATLAGAALYLLVFVPHFWNGPAYAGRDFSTAERLLTQGRVLCLHVWQILVPWPRSMPFYYDWLPPSRGLLEPWTTLPAIGTVLALLGIAWWQRGRNPLFSLGVFLFFSAHFIASNVIGLELAFEHRNHFALIGAVLAIWSLFRAAGERMHWATEIRATAFLVVVLLLASATLLRSHIWRSTLSIAQMATETVPASGRAWTQLCASYFTAGGGGVPDNPQLDRAIEVCTQGAAAVPRSLNSLTLLMVLKTLRGDAEGADWHALQQRIRTAPMTLDNARIFMILTFHARKGVQFDREELLETLTTLADRGKLGPFNLAHLGYFVMNDLEDPDAALPFFIRAINEVPAGDPFPRQLGAELRSKGRPDLAARVEGLSPYQPRL